jgi:acyl CoA:acetate/3-ketoacid CoA transferase beta subunit
MAVLLTQAYEGYLAGTTVNLPTNIETALIAQNKATAATRANTTTGAVTYNGMQGTAAIAAGSSSVVVTTNKCDANSIVMAYVSQAAADGTLLRVERIVPAAGSFTIFGTANATATTLVSWAIVSPSINAAPLS